jgi:hypothetical protein
MTVQIDKNVKMPLHKGSGRDFKYPWHDLQIGDSFLMDNDSSATSLVQNYNSSLPKAKKIKIKTRLENGKRRVWRIK